MKIDSSEHLHVRNSGVTGTSRTPVSLLRSPAFLLSTFCRVLVPLLALMSVASLAQSQDQRLPRDSAAIEAMTRTLAAELRCPVCQGLSIGDSPSELALEMRGVIRDQLVSGKTPAEVRKYFVDKYGEWILLTPEPEGLNLIVYVLPVLAILGGIALVWHVVKRWTARAEAELPGTSS
jgi:cytochrome c-type biogenesis protein CcmH